MSVRTVLALTTLLLTSTAVGARGDSPVPAAFKRLKPYQVIEQIMAQREGLGLTERQFAALDSLSLVVRNEKHQFTHQGGKPHTTQHVPMVSRRQAYKLALAVLTPEQQTRAQYLFPAPAPLVQAERKYTLPHGKP